MYQNTMSVGQAGVSVRVLCPHEAEERGLPSWSLSAIQTQGDVQKHYQLAMGINGALREMKTNTAYAPSVAPASARIVNPSELKYRIRLGSVSLYRNRNIPADGTFLEQEEAFVMSAAGCAVIIASAGRHLIVAHAGRDSLVDRDAVQNISPRRKHLSVIHAIAEAFAEKGLPPEKIVICMQFAIPAEMFEHRFDHPLHGKYNRALKRFIDERWPGCTGKEKGRMLLNLELLLMEQATQAGIRHVWAINSLADFPLLAHTHDGKNPKRRNLLIVKRN